jgi:hypothetical protein
MQETLAWLMLSYRILVLFCLGVVVGDDRYYLLLLNLQMLLVTARRMTIVLLYGFVGINMIDE